MTFYNIYNKDTSGGKGRRLANSATAADKTDENLSDRIIKFTEVLKINKQINK